MILCFLYPILDYVHTKPNKSENATAYYLCRNLLENDNVDGQHFIRFRDKNAVFKFIRLSVDVALD